jgi:AmmeMemoRadiSam system protein B
LVLTPEKVEKLVMNSSLDIRPSPIAGQWYPADPRRLASSVDEYLRAADLPEIKGQIVAIMAPHAGHRYSGPVAGYAFATLRGLEPDVVAVVSPMHYAYFEPILTTAHQAYATPLGQIPVDTGAIDAVDRYLENHLGLRLTRVSNDPEHSLEIELPFLQQALSKPFSLLPVMVRDHDPQVIRMLGNALADSLRDRNALLVASTDLSHFYPQAVANRLDAEVLKRVEAFDPSGVLQVEKEGKGFACGRAALAAVLWAAQELGANDAQVLYHATSGDVTGDYDQVVGYGAAVITRRADRPQERHG